MQLPSSLVYNDLNGEEIKSVLKQRFAQVLDEVPFLRHHLTLPRVSMHLTVHLDQWADQQTPERLEIVDSVTLENHLSAAPTPDGHPPDQVRDEHGLAIPAPHRGDKKIGAHPFIFGAARYPEDAVRFPMGYSGGVPSSPSANAPAILSETRVPAESGGSTSEAAAPAPSPSPAPDPFDVAVRVFMPNGDVLANRVVEAVPGLSIDRTGSGGLTSAGLAESAPHSAFSRM